VAKLKDAGAVIVGKTNLDEFAMGSSTENSAFYPTRNPWDLETVPGGSSGGSAAAVAAGEAVLALGSDTGGSIRQPASFCGVVGLKPTYGRVSRYGLVAFASSLDQIGSLTKDVTDCALVMNSIAGRDEKDSTSVNLPVADYRKALIGNIKKVRVGLISNLMGEGIEAGVKEAVKKAAETLSRLGAEIVEVSLPSFEHAVSAYYLIAPAEASSNLARYDGVKFGHRTKECSDLLSMYGNTRREGFGPEVKRRIILGTYALSAGYYDAYYLKALKVRALIRRDFENAFGKCDILISPAAPTTAFKIGEKTSDPLSMYLSDIATIPVNLAGLPAISLPCGVSQGLPVGLQIIGKAFAEEIILRAAFTYEQNTEWHKKKASV
ncbi:Asp-tRNA(Asn)/Glu-tRNA(Gln) amidotransferase subunit GatA, partial [Candidatus Saganbacteria bacterium]|nr:Asp-tRNA(Asn)/Glu-tRNA(Gln) amidotransferase subunit GatA [Candidatus Saganbacteria bacterium]